MTGRPYMWDAQAETMPREKIREIQNERLRRVVKYCFENMDMYKEKFKEAGLRPDDIQTIEDLSKVPFTTKDDLRARYPLNGLLAVPPEKLARIHMTTGTTGRPTISPFTKADIAVEENIIAKSLAALGVGAEDMVQLMFGYGLFAGSVIVQPVLENLIGASVIPAGAAVPSKTQLSIMQDFKPTVLAATPSFFLHIIEVAKDEGIQLDKLGVLAVITGAEPSSEETRLKISQAFGGATYQDVYGLCELVPHFSTECMEHQGLHLCEDVVIAEIIEPETEKPLAPGQPGMLVVTCLTKEAMPLLRYQTKDITLLDETPCPCGRTHVRMRRPMGRTDDMVKVKGVNVFPSQVESVLKRIEEVKDSEFQILVDRSEKALDILTVKVEVKERTPELSKKIQQGLQADFLGANFKVELVEFGTLPRFTHKAQRLIDTRTL